MKIYKISDVKNAMEKFGIELSIDQIRKLERTGIVICDRKESGHRRYTETQFKKTVRNLLLYYFNVPTEVILNCNIKVIKDRINRIFKALRSI